MRKKLLSLACAVLTILAIHACSFQLPSSIEIKGKARLDLPVNKEKANLGDILRDNIKKALESNDKEESGITVLEYHGSDIMTFLVNYSINPDQNTEELDIVKQFTLADDLDFNTDDFDMNLKVDSSDLGGFEKREIEPIRLSIDLDGLFRDIEEKINEGFGNPGNELTVSNLAVGPGVPSDSIRWDSGNSINVTVIMDEAHFNKGKFYAAIAIGNPSPSPAVLTGANLTFTNIAIIDKSGNPIPGRDKTSGSNIINLTGASPSKNLEFDLSGREIALIDGKLEISIGPYTDTSTVTGAVSLTITPEIMDGLAFKSIAGLKMDYYEVESQTNAVSPGFPDSTFVHAIIQEGTLEYSIGKETAGHSSFNGTFNFEFTISQEDHVRYGTNYTGIYPPFNCDRIENDLAGRQINPENIDVVSDDKITQEPGTTASFIFSDDDLRTKIATIAITPILTIKRFAKLDLDVSEKLDELDPKIPDVDLSKTAEYLKYIEYKAENVGPVIEFGKVTIPGLQLSVKEGNLGINSGNAYKDIKQGATVEFLNNNSKTLYLCDYQGNVAVTKLMFDVDVQLKDGKIITLEDKEPSDIDLVIEMKEVNFTNEWNTICIDPDKFGSYTGSFPGNNEDGSKKEPIDLSILDKYLKGFQFDYSIVETSLYISGPSVLFDVLSPDVVLETTYTPKGGSAGKFNLWSNANTIIQNAGPIDLDPDGTGEYTGQLPEKGKNTISLEPLLRNRPSDLQFDYSVKTKEAIISKSQIDAFDDDIDEPLKLQLFLKLPLRLIADTGGADISFSEFTKDDESDEKPKEDIFGRKDGDTSFIEWIKSCNLRIDLTASVFEGGTLYLDDGIKIIEKELSGKTMILSITGSDLDYINKTKPYDPKMGIRFAPNKRVEIPWILSASRVVFDVDIDAKFDL